MTYPCSRCNMDEGSPLCLQDERCPGRQPAGAVLALDTYRLTANEAALQRPATLLEELDAEAALVPNRRGALYALAAAEIRRLQHAAAANTPPTTAPGQCPMCGEYSMSARARQGLYGHTEQQDGA